MSILFSGSEVITMAIEIEKNGLAFYNALAAKTDNAQSKELFTFLAGEEVRHKVTFQKMLDNLKKAELSASEEEEYNNYLKALTSSRVFNPNADVDAMLKEAGDEAGAVDMAIQAEKDSILFYYELLDQAVEEDQEAIDNVIREEKVHLAKLINLRNSLSVS